MAVVFDLGKYVYVHAHVGECVNQEKKKVA